MNALIEKTERTTFVPEMIKKRGFIRAKYHSWTEPRNGLVMYAAPEFLQVLFQTGVNVATSYYTVKISEVAAGLWEIVYTPDLEHFYKIEGGQAEDEIDLIAEVHKLFEEG